MLETLDCTGVGVRQQPVLAKPRKFTEMGMSLILSFLPFPFQVGLQWPLPRILLPSVSGALQSLLRAV